MKKSAIGVLLLALGFTVMGPASSAASLSPQSSTGSSLVPPPREGNVAGAAPIVQVPNPTDLVYVAVPPCRIADTRKGGGLLGGGGTRTFHVTGTSGFAAAGGATGGCRVPVGAVAASVSVTGTGSTGSGFMTLFAQGTPRPNVSQVSFTKGQNVSTPVDAPLSAASGSVSVFTSATTHVLLDVSGYYTAPLGVSVDNTGVPYDATSAGVSVSHVQTGVFDVTFGRNLQHCVAIASADYFRATTEADAGPGGKPNTVRVYVISTVDGTLMDGVGFEVLVTC